MTPVEEVIETVEETTADAEVEATKDYEIENMEDSVLEEAVTEDTQSQSEEMQTDIVVAGVNAVLDTTKEEVTELVENLTPVEKVPNSAALSHEVAAAFEKGRIQGLQEAIIAIMEKNGYVTDRMRQDVYEQTHVPSLLQWVKSFR